MRPRYLAVAFTAFFAVVAYFAWIYARASKSPWFTPDISRTVYQTTMIGGVLVLVGLIITASIMPNFGRPVSSRGFSTGPPLRSTKERERSRSRFAFLSGPPRNSQSFDPDVTVDDLFDDADIDPSPYLDRDREREVAAVSSALTRLLPATDSVNPGNLMDRLSGMRARNYGPTATEDREMTQVLVRLVNEIKPLLVAAKKAGLNVPEIRRLVAEATTGRETDLAYRVRLVEQLKDTLEAALVERIAEDLQSVLGDIKRTKAASNQVHHAELTAAEGVALLDTGQYLAALDRATKARAAVATQVAMVGPAQAGVEWTSPQSGSVVALAGPSIVASIYVAIGAMFLPGVAGFLATNFVLNTGAILFLSYGWFGLVLYALASIYVLARPPPPPRREMSEEFV